MIQETQFVEVRIVFYDFAGAMPIVSVGQHTQAKVSRKGLEVLDLAVIRTSLLKGFSLVVREREP